MAKVAGNEKEPDMTSGHEPDFSYVTQEKRLKRMFIDNVTLNPNSVQEAMKQLSQDTKALQTLALPGLLHAALLDTLRKRGFIKNERWKRSKGSGCDSAERNR